MIKDFEISYEVCNCKNVSLEEIILTIKNKNVKTLGAIQELTGAGTECRHCIFPETDFGKIKKKIYCKNILEEVLNG